MDEQATVSDCAWSYLLVCLLEKKKMEDEFNNLTSESKAELYQMNRIAFLYEEGLEDECREEIENHRDIYGIKINII